MSAAESDKNQRLSSDTHDMQISRGKNQGRRLFCLLFGRVTFDEKDERKQNLSVVSEATNSRDIMHCVSHGDENEFKAICVENTNVLGLIINFERRRSSRLLMRTTHQRCKRGA